jgi:serine/threonine protein kinase
LAAAPSPVAAESVLSSLANLAGATLDGRYRIESKIGEGGMSFVYRATDLESGEACAIKVLSPALAKDTTSMARLRREAHVGSRLIHPNVCHIRKLGQTSDGLVYVVMPFVDGEVLADRTYRAGQLTLAEVVPFVRQIAAGLQAAHDLGIVHRDLKPENIMICRGGEGANGSERAVVMDFGLAKERPAGPELEKLTATGIVLGTPEFMSPEQLRGKPLDGRSDVYSLALMTYEMLTGKLPFEGKTQQELMIARLRNEPIPIRRLRPELDISAAVERVLLKGMARDLDQRYRRAPEFADALASAASSRGSGGASRIMRLFGKEERE